ncbi:MAG: Trk system potassium transporter TrkA [Lachnospiraceae bacterium]|nr:Trk system potassium transporter TrkA [Lachnospiraceae bacterium]
MKIIIAGLGEAGISLVRALSSKEHEITVIDRDAALIDSVTDRYSVNGVVGSSASRETLSKAGMAGTDFFIALTHIDEVNLLSCMQAKNLGATRTVSRLQMPDLSSDSEDLNKEYGIDYIVRPCKDIAAEIYRNLGLPGFVKLEGIFGDQVTLVDINILRDSCLVGHSLAGIRKEIRTDMLISTVIRDDKLIIPDGKFIIEEGDILTISASAESLNDILETLGIKRNPAKSVMMVGCDLTGEYLTEKLLSEGRKVTILESDQNRCRALMNRFPKADIIFSDGDITSVLEEEKLDAAGTVISLTDSDETNLVVSLFAWSKQVPSVITRVDKQNHVRLLHKVNIDITASPTELSVQRILHFIRNTEGHVLNKAAGSYLGFYRVADGMADVMEFSVGSSFHALNTKIADKAFNIKKDIIVSGIIRNDKLIIPDGSSYLTEGDRVLLTAPVSKGIKTLGDAFH